MGRPERIGVVYAGTHQNHRSSAFIATLVREELNDCFLWVENLALQTRDGACHALVG